MIQVDDSVILLDDHFEQQPHHPEAYRRITYPSKGVRYTVRAIIHTPYGTGILLKEIINPKIHHTKGGYQEPIFSIERFKKLTNEGIPIL